MAVAEIVERIYVICEIECNKFIYMIATTKLRGVMHLIIFTIEMNSSKWYGGKRKHVKLCDRLGRKRGPNPGLRGLFSGGHLEWRWRCFCRGRRLNVKCRFSCRPHPLPLNWPCRRDSRDESERGVFQPPSIHHSLNAFILPPRQRWHSSIVNRWLPLLFKPNLNVPGSFCSWGTQSFVLRTLKFERMSSLFRGGGRARKVGGERELGKGAEIVFFSFPHMSKGISAQ